CTFTPLSSDQVGTGVSPLTPNIAPLITFMSSYRVMMGDTISFSVPAVDPNPGQTLTYSLGGDIPPGATFDGISGIFNWTATVPGTYNVTFTAADNGTPPLSDNQTIVIQADAPDNSAPQFANIPDYTGVKGDN